MQTFQEGVHFRLYEVNTFVNVRYKRTVENDVYNGLNMVFDGSFLDSVTHI